MFIIIKLISTAITLYSYALLAYLVLNIIMPGHSATLFLKSICEPVLQPVRKFLYRTFPALYKFPIDFSPLLVFFIINLLEGILFRLLFRF